MVERDTIQSLCTVKSLARRAKTLQSFIRPASYTAQAALMRQLTACGKPALQVLRTLLYDETQMRLHHAAAKAIVEIIGKAASNDLMKVVREELAFWKEAGPSLKPGWWGDADLGKERNNELYQHYGRLYYILSEVRKRNFGVDIKLMKATHQLWTSLPQLEEHDQVADECEKILAASDR